jgi:distribution and morphology protein 10
MTLTINPLMGNLSSTYTVVASEMLTLSSCFDFNFYSYESELKLGLELWRRQRSPPVRHRDLNHTNKDSNKPNTREESPHPQQTPLSPPPPLLPPFPQNPQNKQQDLNKTTSEKNEEEEEEEENISGVLKAKIDQRGAIALLWEGRVKDLLYGCGVVLDARRGEGMTRSVGLEISYSS